MKTALLGVLVGASLLSTSAAVMPPAKKMPQHNFAKMKSATVYTGINNSVRAYNDDEAGDYMLAGVEMPASMEDRKILGQRITDLVAGEDVWILESDNTTEVEVFRKPDGMNVNLELVRSGVAKAEPDDFADARRDMYHTYEQRARMRFVGVWESDKPKPSESRSVMEDAVYEDGVMYHKHDKCGRFNYIQPTGRGARGYSVFSARKAQLIPCPKCKPER